MTDKQIRAAASAFGRLGGRSGRGAAKARTRKQAQKAAKARWANIKTTKERKAS